MWSLLVARTQKLAIPLSDTVLAVAMCDCGDILWHRRLWSTTRTTFAINCTKHHVFLMDLRGNLNPNPRLVIDSSNISCDKATTLPDSEHQIITHHSVSTDDSNSEFTSLDGASRTRTLQEADSIAFIQVSNCQFSDQTFSGSGVVFSKWNVSRPPCLRLAFREQLGREEGRCISTHYSDHTFHRCIFRKNTAAERGGTHNFNQPDLIFFEDSHFDENTTLEYWDNAKDFAFNLCRPEAIDSCAVACGDNLRSGQVQQRENRKVAYLLSSDATSASTHPSTATTDAPTTAKAEPCPESLVRRLSGNARPSALPTLLHSALSPPTATEGSAGSSARSGEARAQVRMWAPDLREEQHSSGTACHNQSTSSAAACGASEVSEEGRQNELRADRVGVQQFRQLRLFVSVQRQHKVKQLQRTHRTQAFLHNPLLHQLRKRLRNMKRRVLLDRRSETAQCRLQFRPEQQKVHLQQHGSASAEQGIPATACSARRKRATSGRMTASIGKRTETAEPARQTATPRSAVEKGQQTKRQQQRQSKVPKFLFFCAIHRRTAESGQNSVNAVSRDAQRRQLFDNCSGNMRASENNGEGT
ncbi:hypothetical protein BLNAU_25041 [Blattamonas nauphoetae]|uniref:Uncharacterized protein n=1 Tax=Blattamonas nauphoetae TaxID=2049346 RepID=A0ABQ9WMQ8_9EUKA|nr:hypothetical protein BLNAU_25041 [Blattamonas nauphoetae]